MESKTFNLNNKLHSNNFTKAAKTIRGIKTLTDVTLACDDGEIEAHKFVLFSCSEFFQDILSRMTNPKPYIYLKHTNMYQLQIILDFMYEGEVSVAEDDVKDVLAAADDLKVRGLMESHDKQEDFTEKVNEIKEKIASVLHKSEHNQSFDSSISLDETVSEDKNSHEKCLEMMERKTEGGKKVWTCKFCQKSSNDKTRIRKHVESHLSKLDRAVKDEDMNNESMFNLSLGSKTSSPLSTEDIKALMMMKRIRNDEGKHVWICNVCDKTSIDKTRIRKHIKSNHLSQNSHIKEETEDMVENIFS